MDTYLTIQIDAIFGKLFQEPLDHSSLLAEKVIGLDPPRARRVKIEWFRMRGQRLSYRTGCRGRRLSGMVREICPGPDEVGFDRRRMGTPVGFVVHMERPKIGLKKSHNIPDFNLHYIQVEDVREFRG